MWKERDAYIERERGKKTKREGQTDREGGGETGIEVKGEKENEREREGEGETEGRENKE